MTLLVMLAAVSIQASLGGGPEWVRHAIDDTSRGADGVKLADVEGDGDLDVLTCEERDQLGIIWYENPQR